MKMKDLFNPHLFSTHHFNVPVNRTTQIFDLMVAKGDLSQPENLTRPINGTYENVTVATFMEGKIIPENLLDATIMARGEWYYTRYSSWFNEFLWQVFQLCREQRRRYRTSESLPCESILDEKPGAFFFIKRADAYRSLKDPKGIKSNVSNICEFGHIEPLLFLLTYADKYYEQQSSELGTLRKDHYSSQHTADRHSDEFFFRHQLRKISYSRLQSEATELAIRGWNERMRKFKQAKRH